MKWVLSSVVAIVFTVVPSVRGAGLSAQERAFFDKHISKIVQVEPSRMSGPALSKVFQATLYKVTVTIDQGESGKQTMELIVARMGQELVDVSLPSTTQNVPQLKAMLRPGFKLKTEADAQTLQAALDALYPISDSFGGEDLKAKGVKHAGNQWLFIRGVFFKKHKGFAFTTDPAGDITAVNYSLDLP